MTTIEIIVAISIAVIVMLSLTTILLHIFTTKNAASQEMALVKEGQDAIDRIARDVRYANTFLDTTNIEDVDESWSPTTTWDFTGQNEHMRQLILEIHATTKNHVDPATALVRLKNPDTCETTSDYLKVNIVYFVKDGTLYRRTVVPPETASCPGEVFQKQTCRNTEVSASCEQTDVVVARGVTQFSLSYYTNPYDASPYDVYNPEEGALPNAGQSLRVQLTVGSPNPNTPDVTTNILFTKGNV